jgi:hypothetical protein
MFRIRGGTGELTGLTLYHKFKTRIILLAALFRMIWYVIQCCAKCNKIVWVSDQPSGKINNYMSKFIIQESYILNVKLTTSQSAVKFPDKIKYLK